MYKRWHQSKTTIEYVVETIVGICYLSFKVSDHLLNSVLGKHICNEAQRCSIDQESTKKSIYTVFYDKLVFCQIVPKMLPADFENGCTF